MKKKQTPLAKITRPELPGLLARRRLFRTLDLGRKRPVIWITGPPGCGKTTLVASYAAARKLHGLWYQIDRGDTDLATFFSYMREAARRAAPRYRRPLPLLTPEYWLRLSVFSRRYFRELCQRMKPPFIMVFDNYNELAPYARLHDVLGEALREIPQGGSAIIISRDQPPQSMAALRAANCMTIVGPEALQLSLRESREIARLRSATKLAEQAVKDIQRKTKGWAAGLILMLEGREQQEAQQQAQSSLDPAAVFDYFAGEVFQKESPEVQDFLLKTGFLEKMTGRTAAQLTGFGRAERILADLNRRNFFTERRFRSPPLYQYHPLFREFLVSRARETFSTAKLRGVQAQAASLLAQAGYVEDAIALLQEIEDWQAVRRLILEQASTIIAQGRMLTLEEWLRSLPEEILASDAWLQYWLGSCRLMVTPAQSRYHFEKAYHLFERQGDRAGLLSSWCGAVGSILYEWGDFTRIDQWISRLETLLDADRAFPSLEIEARVACDMFGALMFRQPDHPDITLWAKRAFSLSRESGDVNRRLLIGALLTLYHLWMGDFGKAAVVISSLRELGDSTNASPLVRITQKLLDAYYQWHTESAETCLAAVSEGLELARTSGVNVWNTLILAQGTAACLSSGDSDGARDFLHQISRGLEPGRLLNVSHHHYLAAWEAVLREDYPVALEHTEVALKLAIEIGTPIPEALNHLSMAQIQHEQGRDRKAASHLSKAFSIAERSKSRMLRFMALLTKSYILLDRHERSRGLQSLRHAMSLGARHGYMNSSWWRQPVMARLCVEALAAGIEVRYVQSLVRKRALVPASPPLGIEHWPWTLRIYTLGDFQVVRGGEPLRLARKVQKKPLAMLKAIIAAGGRAVSQEELADWLWPDADGDAAHRALTTTLHRLRQLIGNEKAVQLRGGLMTLDPYLCWVDAWAFEEILNQAAAAEREKRTRKAKELTERALGLYRGPFLAGSDTSPQVLPTSERLRGLFLSHTARLGGWAESKGNWRKAIDCYEKALAVDDLAEEFYQRIMGCYQQLGRRAEGLAVYERCEKILAARLGIRPSPQTESLRLTLHSQ